MTECDVVVGAGFSGLYAVYKARAAGPSQDSAYSKTHTSSDSPPCSTGPTPRSGSTSSTASSPWPSPTSCADKPTTAALDLSVRELLATLGGIQETVLLSPTGSKGRPSAQRILTDTDPTQKLLFELFGLDTDAPQR